MTLLEKNIHRYRCNNTVMLIYNDTVYYYILLHQQTKEFCTLNKGHNSVGNALSSAACNRSLYKLFLKLLRRFANVPFPFSIK